MNDASSSGDCKGRIVRLDHLVLTVASLDATVDFYTQHLGMELVRFGEGRMALKFGNQKINLHEVGREFKPNAQNATPGSADLCFISEVAVEALKARLESEGVAITEGPVPKTGAMGPIRSIYFRDPDGNLIEISNYFEPTK